MIRYRLSGLFGRPHRHPRWRPWAPARPILWTLAMALLLTAGGLRAAGVQEPSGEPPGPIAELELSDLDGVIGFKLNGEVVGDQSGLPVSRAGDLNGDGFDDLVVSAAEADPNGNSSGRVYVVFGRAPGDPFPAELELSSLNGTNGFMVNGEDGLDRAGVAVSAAGDINGDDLDDLLIGAYFVSLPGPLPLIGRSYVVFGRAPDNPFPAELELSGLDGTNGFKIRGEAFGDRSGFAVSAGGDINGDGRDDLLIGAITADPNGLTNAGRVYVVFGRGPEDPFPAELVLSTLDGAIGFKINGEAAGNEAGHAVRAAGDVNGDGVGDVILGARFAAPNGTNSGRSYVVFGRAPGTPFPGEIELSDLDGATGFKLNGEMAHDHSGWDVSAAGDVNGDGFDDVIVGAHIADPNGLVDAGRSYVVFGRAPGDPFPAEIELADLDGSIGFKLNGEAADDQSGVSLGVAGDFNDDGRLDLIIGAHTASPNGLFSAGRTYVVFGRDPANPFPAELELSELNGLYGFKINGESAISSSGRAVDGAGDVNGDGIADLLIGAWAAAPNGNLSGRSYVVYGQPPPSGPVLVISPDVLDFGPQQVGTTSPVSIVTLGNVGTADVHVDDVATPPLPFTAAGGSCGTTPFVLAPGTVCTLDYTFSPTAVGGFDAVVEVVSDAPSSPDGFGLAGEGVQGALTIAPDLVEFGPHPVGTTSGALSVTLENTGTADVHVDSISPAPAPFVAAGGTCGPPPFPVTPGAACTLDYVFSPTTVGSFDAVVEVVSDAPSSPDSFGLAGEGVPAPPQIHVDPGSLEVTLPQDDATTEILTITNGGGEELEWEVVEQPDLSGLAAFGDLTTITHSASMDIAPDNNVGCSVDGGASTLDTQFLRTFVLDDFDIAHDFEIVEVVFGVQTATAATTVVLNLYTLEGEFTYPNLTLIGSATVDVPVTDLSLQTVPISATVPAGATLVVEIAAPDLNGVSAFVAGSNALGETAPSYFASTSCGLAQPIPYGSIGLPQVHLVMAVSGIVRAPPSCERPGWLAADPLAGVVAPGGSQPMDVTFDASGLTPGDYEATLCLSSNDPERPLTTVPLALTVTEAEVENDTILVSRASGLDGVKGNSGSFTPSVSADGRYVAFESSATSLHPDDVDDLRDVFARDLQTHETILVSRASGADAVKGNGPSATQSISADGRYVAFESFATNLHPDDTDAIADVYIRDLQTHETILVSRASGVDGVKGNSLSLVPSISADGRYVAFTSLATNLHPDDTDGALDVLVRDLQTHETILVSRASGNDGVKGNNQSFNRDGSISADGRYVTFTSLATNLHPADMDTSEDAFVRDLQTHETILVSRAGGADGVKGNGNSRNPSISPDGRYVAFTSLASNLHPDDADTVEDALVRDLQTHETILASRAGGADGAKGNGVSEDTSISGDGRYITFASDAANLHPDDLDDVRDVFVRDLQAHETILASRASGAGGVKGNDSSTAPSVSADGRYVAFHSGATNLDPDDADGIADVFARDVLEPAEEAEMTFDPSSLDFGEVEVGTTSPPLTATLHNTGDGDATGLSFTNPGASFAVDTSGCGTTLPADESCEISVTFTPSEPGPAAAGLEVESVEGASAELSLSGNGVEGGDPVIEVDPDSLSSTLPSGETETQPLTIANVGGGVLEWEVTDEDAGLQRIDGITLEPSENNLVSAVIDPAGDFAYFAPSTFGQVIKIDLETFERVDAITLESGVVGVASAVIDPAGDFAYFGTATAPGQVVKINLETFESVDTITLEGGENDLDSAVIDPAGEFAYFGTNTEPGRVIKIDLETLEPVEAITLESGEGSLFSAVIAPAGDFAYFGTTTAPGQIVKIDLETFERVEAITLESGENNLFSAVIDPAGDFAYFGTATIPGQVVKIDLETFARVGAVTLENSETILFSAVIAPAGDFAYFGTATAPGQVVKIDLETFESVDAITLTGPGEILLRSAVIAPAGDFAYFGTLTDPGRVVKIGLGGQDCTLPDWVSVDPMSGSVLGGNDQVVLATFDASDLEPGDYEATLCLASNDPAQPVTLVPLALTVTPSGAPELTFDPPSLDFGEVEVGTTSPPLTATLHNTGDGDATGLSFTNPGAGFAADTSDCGSTLPADESCEISVTFTPAEPGPAAAGLEVESVEGASAELSLSGNGVEGGDPVIEVDPDSLSSTLPSGETETQPLTIANVGGGVLEWEVTDEDAGLERIDGITLESGEFPLQSAVIDPAGDFAYFGTDTGPGRVIKIDLETFERVDAITLESGEDSLVSAVIDPAGDFAYFGTVTAPGQVVKIDLETFERVDAITLESGEDSLLSAVIDPAGDFAYFGTVTLPGRVVKIDLETFERVDAITLESGEANLFSAVIDPAGDFAYFGTFTAPGRVVKIDLETFESVDAITLESGEDSLFSAVIAPAGDFAYFGTFTFPGRVVEIDLETFQRVEAITLESGEDNLFSAVIDPAGEFAYFGTLTFPGRVVKIDLETFERVEAVELEIGEDFLLSAVIAPAGDFAYFGTLTDPGRVVKIGLGGQDCALPDWVSVDPMSGSVLGGNDQVALVAFDASDLEPGDYEATLCLASNDPAQPVTLVPLALTVTPSGAPELAFAPESLDFGEVEVGSTSLTQTATLQNIGSGDVTGLTFGPTDGGFEADASACGDTLPSGATCPVSVTFTPVEPGPVSTTLDVTSDQDASAGLSLAGTGVSDGVITPVALEVDPEALLSDGNEVFEPGELIEVAPAWRNDGPTMEPLVGAASNFTGSDGATYFLALEDADYGNVEPGATSSCRDTGDGGVCYFLAVNDPSPRPAAHWEASFEETLSDADATTKTWSLHIGDSFADVPRSSPFYASIETLLHHGVTGGCSDTEFCPAGNNTRAQMAAFLLKTAEGGDFTPTPCDASEPMFADVSADSTFCPWIEELAGRGITTGCGGGNYCPGDSVTRAQMAVFLLKAFEGGSYAPPECAGEFTDVTCPSTFADWVEELSDRGITGGCSTDPPAYCPAAPVTRAQMAVFVTKTFGLTLYGP